MILIAYGYVNGRQCYVTCKLPVLLFLDASWFLASVYNRIVKFEENWRWVRLF
jgi:hypothetical protein